MPPRNESAGRWVDGGRAFVERIDARKSVAQSNRILFPFAAHDRQVARAFSAQHGALHRLYRARPSAAPFVTSAEIGRSRAQTPPQSTVTIAHGATVDQGSAHGGKASLWNTLSVRRALAILPCGDSGLVDQSGERVVEDGVL